MDVLTTYVPVNVHQCCYRYVVYTDTHGYVCLLRHAGLEQLLAMRTSRRFISSRLTADVEITLQFIALQVWEGEGGGGEGRGGERRGRGRGEVEPRAYELVTSTQS